MSGSRRPHGKAARSSKRTRIVLEENDVSPDDVPSSCILVQRFKVEAMPARETEPKTSSDSQGEEELKTKPCGTG
jgi:hypothetical protein